MKNRMRDLPWGLSRTCGTLVRFSGCGLSQATTVLFLFFAFAVHSNCLAGDEQKPDASKIESLTSNPDIEKLLEPIREKYKVPGIVAGIVHGGSNRLDKAGAVGLRKQGSPEGITVNDELHLGSNTKAMTATLLGRLVEEKKLKWNSTVAEIFADVKSELHADFHDVTLLQLLTHRAGLPANGPWWQLGEGSLIDQRETLLKVILGKPSVYPPGTKTLYSNVGYVIAGHMAERVTDKSWEDLITEKLFEPLGMKSAGFGVPGVKDEVTQPWGHHLIDGKLQPLQIDNDPALGPAGTVHCSLQDWSEFVLLHLRAAGGRFKWKMMDAETFKVLQTPVGAEDFACGWIVTERPWARGPVLTHSGTNTTWYATVWIAPKLHTAFLAVANQGGEAGQSACDECIVQLIEYNEKMARMARQIDQ